MFGAAVLATGGRLKVRELRNVSDEWDTRHVCGETNEIGGVGSQDLVAAMGRRQHNHRVYDVGLPGASKQFADRAGEAMIDGFNEGGPEQQRSSCVSAAPPYLRDHGRRNSNRRVAGHCHTDIGVDVSHVSLDGDEGTGI